MGDTTYGLFLPKSYLRSISDYKTQTLDQKQKCIPPIPPDPSVYTPPSITSYFLLAVLLIIGLTLLVINVLWWLQIGSIIGLLGTESLILVTFSSILAAWVRTYSAQPIKQEHYSHSSNTVTMRRMSIKRQINDSAQFHILKQDTQLYLVALQAKRGQEN